MQYIIGLGEFIDQESVINKSYRIHVLTHIHYIIIYQSKLETNIFINKENKSQNQEYTF